MSKTIFITGASSGLGKATAKLFQSKNWNVIATMRNPENETELSQLENITLLPLDVSNLDQIESTVEKAIALHSMDVVFNNAGYGLMGICLLWNLGSHSIEKDRLRSAAFSVTLGTVN